MPPRRRSETKSATSSSLVLSDIEFIGQCVKQIVDHGSKRKILDAIERLGGVKPGQKLPEAPTRVTQLDHTMSLHCGKSYWLWCTQHPGHGSLCALVDRKVHPGYPFPKIMVLPLAFANRVYNQTLFEVELAVYDEGCGGRTRGDGGGGIATNTTTATRVLLLSDLLVYDGEPVQSTWSSVKRFHVMGTLLEKHYQHNALQPCELHVKRLFPATLSGMEELLRFVHDNHLFTSWRGIMFYPREELVGAAAAVQKDDRCGDGGGGGIAVAVPTHSMSRRLLWLKPKYPNSAQYVGECLASTQRRHQNRRRREIELAGQGGPERRKRGRGPGRERGRGQGRGQEGRGRARGRGRGRSRGRGRGRSRGGSRMRARGREGQEAIHRQGTPPETGGGE